MNVSVASGVTLTSGTLVYYPVNDPSASVTLNANTTGSGTIGTIDTTTLLNGTYYILLSATNDQGQTQGSAITVVVGGNYKPGRVTTTVTDLTVPAPGIPIQISRTYDSLLKNDTTNDLGYGWSLGIKVELEVATTNDITLTLNGQRRTFYFTPVSGGALNFLYSPAYTAEPGMFGTLAVTQDNCGGVLVQESSIYICAANNLYLYTPEMLTYTDPYGRVYTFAGDGSIQSIHDVAGNTLTVTPQGITGSNGLVVQFLRDTQGRVTTIIDPLGNQYQYGYDANGNLATVTYPGIATPAQ